MQKQHSGMMSFLYDPPQEALSGDLQRCRCQWHGLQSLEAFYCRTDKPCGISGSGRGQEDFQGPEGRDTKDGIQRLVHAAVQLAPQFRFRILQRVVCAHEACRQGKAPPSMRKLATPGYCGGAGGFAAEGECLKYSLSQLAFPCVTRCCRLVRM